MRYLAFFFVVAFFISCKKNDVIDHQRMIVGDKVGMMTIQHDSVVEGPEYWNSWFISSTDKVLLDVDNDSINDFSFHSYVDTIPSFNGSTNISYLVYGKSVNNNFQIAAIPESGIIYRLDSVWNDYYGTFPREINRTQWYCEQVPGSIGTTNSPFQANIVQPFSSGDYIFEGLNWFEQPHFSVSLYHNSFEEANCVFSSGGDSLICHYDIFPKQCTSIRFNQNFYLVFKKNSTPVRYGWIEMRLENTHRLRILESVIQL